MSELQHSIVNTLTQDPEFIKLVENKLTEIMKDGKVDTHDIPNIILIVLDCAKNLSKFNLNYDQFQKVLEELITFILNHFNLIPREYEKEFKTFLNTSLKLVMYQPKITSTVKIFFIKIWNFVTCKK